MQKSIYYVYLNQYEDLILKKKASDANLSLSAYLRNIITLSNIKRVLIETSKFNCTVGFLVNSKQQQLIELAAKQLKTSKSNVIRSLILQDFEETDNPFKAEKIVLDTKSYDALKQQIRAVGRNLNQVARLCNLYRKKASVTRYINQEDYSDAFLEFAQELSTFTAKFEELSNKVTQLSEKTVGVE